MSKILQKCQEWARGLSGYNGRGEELPDPTPVELPVDFERPVPLAEEIRRLVRSEAIQAELRSKEIETFDEANDFDIPDDPIDPETPWQDEAGSVWTRESELAAGIVSEPDYVKAKELVARANKAIAEFEAKRKGAPEGAKA